MTARHAAAPLAAYVLHAYDWSESSLIVELFTREGGRIVVAAKGAKRPTSQLRAVLLPFQRILITPARGARDDTGGSEIRNLRGAEWGGGVPVVAAEGMLSGFYLNELIMKLLARDDPHPRLWDAYAATLPALGGADEAAALRAFELTLLAETGHLPDLGCVTATQAPLAPGGHYALRPEAGIVPLAADHAEAIAAAAFAALREPLHTRDAPALRAACTPIEPRLRRQLRQALAYHLGPAPLRTRELVRELQPLMDER